MTRMDAMTELSRANYALGQMHGMVETLDKHNWQLAKPLLLTCIPKLGRGLHVGAEVLIEGVEPDAGKEATDAD
jgi:hypothetical protein